MYGSSANISRRFDGGYHQVRPAQMLARTAEKPPVLLRALEAQLDLFLVLRPTPYTKEKGTADLGEEKGRECLRKPMLAY